MNGLVRAFLATTLTLTGFSSVPVALAQSNPAYMGEQLGCIWMQPDGTAKFLNANRTRATIADEIQKVASQRTLGAIDPCLAGKFRNIPASAYAKLASRFPARYQPLAASEQQPAAKKISPGTIGAPRYDYVNLDTAVPSGFIPFFLPVSISAGGKVAGLTIDESFNIYVSTFNQGSVKILRTGTPSVINNAGKIGGAVLDDPQLFLQAALFDDNGVELIPRVTGETESVVLFLNDTGTAVVFSIANETERYELYKNGVRTPLTLPFTHGFSLAGMNNEGIIAGTANVNGELRAFRFDTRNGRTEILPPLPTEPSSAAEGINNRGDILGYSFVAGGLERIGIWNRNGEFEEYFVEGTIETPTVSNRLAFNDSNLIAITFVSRPDSEVGNSYLVTKPGVRSNLVDLVDAPIQTVGAFSFIEEVATNGSIIGGGSISSFLLPRR